MRNKKLVLILIIGFLLALAAIYAVFFSPSKNNDYASFTNSFVEKMSQNDSGGTYGLLTESMKQTVSEADWKKQLDTASSSYPKKCDKITLKEVEDPQNSYQDKQPMWAYCDLSLNGESYKLTFVLIRNENSFLVDQFTGYKNNADS